MTHSQIAYGDRFSIQPRLARIVDLAVVKFINQHNGEPDLKEGFDNPFYHLPNPTAVGPPRIRAHRRWHGAALWMVLKDEQGVSPTPSVVTRRVTIQPDDEEPDTLSFTPDIIVTRGGGGRFTLPGNMPHFQEFRRQVNLSKIYIGLILGTADGERAEAPIINALHRAWKFTAEFHDEDATLPIP